MDGKKTLVVYMNALYAYLMKFDVWNLVIWGKELISTLTDRLPGEFRPDNCQSLSWAQLIE